MRTSCTTELKINCIVYRPFSAHKHSHTNTDTNILLIPFKYLMQNMPDRQCNSNSAVTAFLITTNAPHKHFTAKWETKTEIGREGGRREEFNYLNTLKMISFTILDGHLLLGRRERGRLEGVSRYCLVMLLLVLVIIFGSSSVAVFGI